MSRPMRPPRKGVKVRMYRPGAIGDCFLCACRAEDGGARYILVDCGSLADTEVRQRKMREIVTDIAGACGGRLHLVVVSHEHWDHLSGFQLGRETFNNDIRVDRVWLPWTADPRNRDARRLQQRRRALLALLRSAVAELRKTDPKTAETVAGVLGFWGKISAASGTPETARQIRYLRGLGAAEVCYLQASDAPIEMPELDPLRFHVLGPPHDLEMLNRANPFDAAEPASPSSLSRVNAGLAAALGFDFRGSGAQREGSARDAAIPFDKGYRIPIRDGEEHEDFADFFGRFYGFGARSRRAPRWRRLEGDFLTASAGLATQLDTDVNNGSLALAIELPGREVLLFAGDAQTDAWAGWHRSRPPDRGHASAADLLRRTVLYKISHHASRDGTPTQNGLDLMTAQNLVAMAPVDERQAAQRGWYIPSAPILAAISRQTAGRILRADQRHPQAVPAGLSSQARRAAERFRGRIKEKRLWSEIELP